VQVIRGRENLGPARGRNILLKASRSDYIHFHDSDDLFCQDWCRCVRHAILDTGADVVFTDITTAYYNGGVLSERILDIERLVAGEDIVKFAIEGSLLTSCSTVRRDAALAIGGYRESLRQSEDFDFHIRLVASGITYTLVKEPLVTQRIRKFSYSSDNLKTAWASMIESVRLLSHELDSKYRLDLAEAAVRGGLVLLKLGARNEAREAFRLADELGPPGLSKQKRLYRIVAKTMGVEVAERLAAIYRSMIPQRFHLA
jgi:GT2 family glycosyltransferase